MKIKEQSSKQLGYTKLETAEIVSNLDKNLSNYQIFYHKLQGFHWNVVGGDFFEVHEVTEKMYKMAAENIDEIAERIRIFGVLPEVRLQNYMKNAIIEQTDTDKSSQLMIFELIKDIQSLTESLLGTHESASANGDVGTALMVSEMIKELETFHWQLSSWANRRFAN